MSVNKSGTYAHKADERVFTCVTSIMTLFGVLYMEFQAAYMDEQTRKSNKDETVRKALANLFIIGDIILGNLSLFGQLCSSAEHEMYLKMIDNVKELKEEYGTSMKIVGKKDYESFMKTSGADA